MLCAVHLTFSVPLPYAVMLRYSSKARLGAIVGYLIFLFSMLGGIALECVIGMIACLFVRGKPFLVGEKCFLIFAPTKLRACCARYVDSVPLKMGLAVWPPVAFFEVLYLTLLADGVGGPGIQFTNFLDPNLTSVGVSFGYVDSDTAFLRLWGLFI